MLMAIRASRKSSALWWAKGGVYGLAAVAALVARDPALAATNNRPQWFERPFHYVVFNQDVRGILTEFGRDVGVPVILSDKITGRVRGEVVERTKRDAGRQTAGEFLSRLAEANGLTWYFDGSILYVSVDQEFSTQLVEVGTLDPATIIAELQRLSLLDDRFSVRAASDRGLISVSGPPAFIAIVRQVVEKLRPPPMVAGDDPRVRVFRGGAPAEVVRTQVGSQAPGADGTAKAEAARAQAGSQAPGADGTAKAEATRK